jgi:HAD superfamily hydrolase (TIGR01458 family)
MGVAATAAELFTPADAARRWLEERNLAPDLLVHPNLVIDFEGVAGTSGRAVVVGDAGDSFTYAALNRAFRFLREGAAFVALARNRMFKDADGGLSLDAGPFVAALEFASGREAVTVGKPSPDFFAAACVSAGCRREEAAIVGDDAENDVAGALAAGVGRAILVRTGKYVPGAEHQVHPPPTAVVEDLAAAVALILGEQP